MHQPSTCISENAASMFLDGPAVRTHLDKLYTIGSHALDPPCCTAGKPQLAVTSMADTHFSASTSGLSEEAAFHNLVTKTDASGKRRRHKRRRWLQGVLITAAASVAILAGAGTAVMLLRPKMQELELSCQQVSCDLVRHPLV